jgi:hypothetical protein
VTGGSGLWSRVDIPIQITSFTGPPAAVASAVLALEKLGDLPQQLGVHLAAEEEGSLAACQVVDRDDDGLPAGAGGQELEEGTCSLQVALHILRLVEGDAEPGASPQLEGVGDEKHGSIAAGGRGDSSYCCHIFTSCVAVFVAGVPLHWSGCHTTTSP